MDVLFTNHGFATMTAANGREALERMRNRRPCVVLLDLMMPIIDGWEFEPSSCVNHPLRTSPWSA